MYEGQVFSEGSQSPPNFFDIRDIDIRFREKVCYWSDHLPYWYTYDTRHNAAVRQAYYELGYYDEAERYK